MINDLKATLLPYVRDATSVDVWIDEGRAKVLGRTQMRDEEIVIDIWDINPGQDHNIIAAAGLWYEENEKRLPKHEKEAGFEYDTIIANESDVGLQIRLKVRRKYIFEQTEEGLIDGRFCDP